MGTIVRFHTNSCCDHRPWTWGNDAENAIRKILKLRSATLKKSGDCFRVGILF